MKKSKTSWDGGNETHPWTRFPLIDNSATHLIIGSFPPNKFTLYPDKLTMCDTEFFYGSKNNEFWELFIKAHGLKFKWPDNFDQIKGWINTNKWAITDIVATTQRIKDSALDSDLLNPTWNIEPIDTLLSKNPIKFIYFTSSWVSTKFHKHIAPKLSIKKEYDKTILISPSRNGLRTVSRAKFLRYEMRDNETATEFRLRYYRQALTLK
jgi:hypothetical protein